MAKFTKEQLDAFNEEGFYEAYISILTHRLTDSGLEIEDIDHYNAVKIMNSGEALRLLLEHLADRNENILNEDIIIKVANIINKDEEFISEGYRKIGDSLTGDSSMPITKPDRISFDMRKLLYRYHNTWKDLDVFERESRFNYEFIRIHPFEDGNGRTSRLLLCFNLLRAGHAPVIIPPYLREKYFEAWRNKDVEQIKKIFEDLSEKEVKIIDMLMQQYSFNKEINYSAIR